MSEKISKVMDARARLIDFCEDEGLSAPEALCACLATAAALALSMGVRSSDEFATDAKCGFDATLADWTSAKARTHGAGNA